MNDDAKRAILARRARFVAAAVAGVAVTACDSPRACLEPPIASTLAGTAPDGTTPPRPTVCLSMVPRLLVDAGASTDDAPDAAPDAAKDAARDAAKDAANDASRR